MSSSFGMAGKNSGRSAMAHVPKVPAGLILHVYLARPAAACDNSLPLARRETPMARIFLTHIPQMRRDYYGERALAALRQHGEVVLNPGDTVLEGRALAEAARGCEIIVSDRMTPGPAAVFENAPDLCAFLRVAVDIRN